ncbi:LysR family transcriptional regulator [Acidisoma silvae]|uniref:LysR family transcriptional regulator n=1 Tax=Acidisoma silvae TaxID=2802396 RepID=A0A964DY92_9PROT|nr:LysR family transcriptional regulator [Acidisoma silvae]MCB8874503.1 LysR family transcriptional regulator [Acidisoma silvae]
MAEQTGRFDGIIEFVEAARLGSFTAAGNLLGVTNSAIGKSVTRLEARLGTKLLHRTTRKLTLTNEGEAYFESCLGIMDQLESVETSLATGRATPLGRVRLDLPAAFGRRHILPILNALSLQYARLDFSVNFSERTADIIAEGIDLAIRIGALGDHADLVAKRLGTQRLMICAAPSYLSRHGQPTELAELSRRDCFGGWRRNQRPGWLIKDAAGNTAFEEIRVRHEFSDGEAMVSAALAGCGLCQLPTWLIGDHLRSGSLVSVLESFSGAEMPIHALWPRSRYMQPKLRVVIDAVTKAALAANSGFDM